MKPAAITSFILVASSFVVSCSSPEPLPAPGEATVDFPIARFKGGMGVEYRFFENGKFE